MVEERTGLHELEFIEVRRHWFAEQVAHDTEGTRERAQPRRGRRGRGRQPDRRLRALHVHYAETFIVPAAVGPYIIRRTARSRSERFGTVKASVRGTTHRPRPDTRHNPPHPIGTTGTKEFDNEDPRRPPSASSAAIAGRACCSPSCGRRRRRRRRRPPARSTSTPNKAAWEPDFDELNAHERGRRRHHPEHHRLLRCRPVRRVHQAVVPDRQEPRPVHLADRPLPRRARRRGPRRRDHRHLDQGRRRGLGRPRTCATPTPSTASSTACR